MTVEDIAAASKLLTRQSALKAAAGKVIKFNQPKLMVYAGTWHELSADVETVKTAIFTELRKVENELRSLGVEIL